MGQMIKIVVGAGVILATGLFAIRAYERRGETAAFQARMADLRQGYLERAAFVRSIADAEAYRDAQRSLHRWYFGELQDIDNVFPGYVDVDRAMAQVQEQVQAGRIESKDLPKYEEWYKVTRDFYDLLREGKYRPILTSFDDTLRFDVYRMERVTEDGKQRIKVDFALWGVLRNLKREPLQGGGTLLKMQVPVSFRTLGFRFIDEKNKIYGEMSGGGEPYMKVDYPERWIETFPPQVLIGTYYFDLFPHEAEKVDLSLHVEARAHDGQEAVAEYKWEVPTRPEWRLAEGQKWEAEEMEMPEEYIERKTDDPSGAP